MTSRLQFKRYDSNTISHLIGANGELIIDTTNKTVTVHDGKTIGGSRVATEYYVQTHGVANSYANLVSGSYTVTLNPNDGTLALQNTLIFGDGTKQNTAFIGYATDNTARTIAQAAYNQANTGGSTVDTYARTTANNASNNITVLQGEINSANANISILFGIETTQNTNISAVNNYSYSAYTQANSASSNTLYLQGGLNTANANVNILFGIETTQNSSIQSAWNQANSANILAQAAFNKANTGGGSSTDQYARDTANSAGTVAQASFNKANTAYSLASGSIQNAFYAISVGGTQQFTATNSDTINFIAGSNVSISACSSTKSITFSASFGGGGSGSWGAGYVFPLGSGASSGYVSGPFTIPSAYTSSSGFILLAGDFSGGSIVNLYDGTAGRYFSQHSWNTGTNPITYQLSGYGSGGDSFTIQTSGSNDYVGYGPGFVVTSADITSSGSLTTSYSWGSSAIAPGNPGLYTTQNNAYGCLNLGSSYYSSVAFGLTAGSGVSMYLDPSHYLVWFKVPGTVWGSGLNWATYPGSPPTGFNMTTMFFGQ